MAEIQDTLWVLWDGLIHVVGYWTVLLMAIVGVIWFANRKNPVVIDEAPKPRSDPSDPDCLLANSAMYRERLHANFEALCMYYGCDPDDQRDSCVDYIMSAVYDAAMTRDELDARIDREQVR